MEVHKIFGPPGTGKTTHLLSLLENEFKTIHPSQCAFVSFTRKGTYEGVQRAKAQFDLSHRELPFFKTIHALCFAQLGARKYDMLQKSHYKTFSEAMGMRFLGFYTEELTSNNDQYLFAEQLMRNNPKAAQSFTRDMNAKKLSWVCKNYRQFKKQLGVIDFTDLLERYLVEGENLPVKVAFIDEAQDLTTLQWRVVQKMFCSCDRLYIAGDDDQAIYEWSGADVDLFLQHPGKPYVLSHSYRLPEAVHSYAATISAEIRNRKEKQFTPNDHEGVVEYTTSWDDIDLRQGEQTLILSRNNCFLTDAEEALQRRGLVYFKKGALSVEPRVLSSIRAYEEYRAGKKTRQEIALYSPYFKTLDEPEIPWFLVLNRDKEEIDYYRSMIANKVDVSSSTISLETIHSSKGSESDHVILIMDVTNRVNWNFENNPDSELRCLYVGATRARKKLTIKLSNSRHSFPTFKGALQ